jgi:tRNA threonylcarbamoyladenosine biosynthesis protein TsaE
MEPIAFLAENEDETRRLGHLLADLLPPGTVVALSGTLGAGKTRLVQAIAVALGVASDRVVSPTFTLCHEYAGRLPLYHLDLYRIADADELQELGLEEYFESGGITFVEWADRFPQQLPADRIEIQIELLDETSRRFWMGTTSPDDETWIRNLAQRWTTDCGGSGGQSNP